MSSPVTSTIYPSRGFNFEYSSNASQLQGIKPDCSLFLLHVLPSDVFVDRYELQGRGFDFNLYGESDLERPLTAMGHAGSTLEIRVPAAMTVTVPLHARYPLPSNLTHSVVRVPFPQTYWACHGSRHSGDDPFLHLTTPYSRSFDLNNWAIYSLDLGKVTDYHVIQVPTGQKGDLAFVEFGTALAILVAALYIFRAIWKVIAQQRVNPIVEKRD